MKRGHEKPKARGRKMGFPMPAERLDDLFAALKVNAKKLADILDLAPSLIVHWKSTQHIQPKHLRECLKLLERVKIQDSEQKAALKRIRSHLAHFEAIDEATGSANPSPQSALLVSTKPELQIVADNKEKVDLSKISDRILIDELKRRDWDVSKMLLEAASSKKKK